MKHGHISTGNIAQTSPNYALVASGTTAQRPPVGKTGMLRFNTDLGYFECFVAGVGACQNKHHRSSYGRDGWSSASC